MTQKEQTIGEAVGIRPPSRRWGGSSQLVADNTFVGLEIELENIRLSQKATIAITSNGLWVVTDDGSLRNNGKEFIMCEAGTGQPLLGNDIIRALDDFDETMKILMESPHKPVLSQRTSTHVHLDVRAFTHNQLKRLILLYYTFEEMLFKWIGHDRYRSNYCRMSSLYTDIGDRASRVFNPGISPADFAARGNKYDALNYAAIRNLGTVEIRIAQAFTKKSDILRWINLLLRIHEAAKDETISINQFPEMVSDRGMSTFIKSVFKEQYVELEGFSAEADVLRGVRASQELMVVGNMSRFDANQTEYMLAHADVTPETNPLLKAFKGNLDKILGGEE